MLRGERGGERKREREGDRQTQTDRGRNKKHSKNSRVIRRKSSWKKQACELEGF